MYEIGILELDFGKTRIAEHGMESGTRIIEFANLHRASHLFRESQTQL